MTREDHLQKVPNTLPRTSMHNQLCGMSFYKIHKQMFHLFVDKHESFATAAALEMNSSEAEQRLELALSANDEDLALSKHHLTIPISKPL
jgi:hypothetical protein